MTDTRTFKTVFFFANGNLAVFDRAGEQIPEEQINLFYQHLAHLRDRGLLADDTEILLYGEAMPFGEFRSRLDPEQDPGMLL